MPAGCKIYKIIRFVPTKHIFGTFCPTQDENKLAGSGKSTAVKVAQKFFYDFCLAVGVMWSDKTFLFTAYMGAAASLFGGVTIAKAAFFNQQKA